MGTTEKEASNARDGSAGEPFIVDEDVVGDIARMDEESALDPVNDIAEEAELQA